MPVMCPGLPGRTRMTAGRRYNGVTVLGSRLPPKAAMKSVIIVSEPLNTTSASAFAFPIQVGVGPAVTSTVIPCDAPNAAAASFRAGMGPPGP